MYSATNHGVSPPPAITPWLTLGSACQTTRSVLEAAAYRQRSLCSLSMSGRSAWSCFARSASRRPRADAATSSSCRSWKTSAASSARSPSWRRMATRPAMARTSRTASGGSWR
uniref:Uncharacterized protein n=1 Tax=Arundo donax TaxID=35708 RepID=A0A0A8XQ62_ARUDO